MNLKILIPASLLVGVFLMYSVLGGCEASKNRSCVGAMLAITSGVAGGYDQYCKDGGNPKADAYLKEITGPEGWLTRRKCPKGGTYSIQIADPSDLDSWKAYKVACTVHGDLQTAKLSIDKSTYDQLRSMLPVATRPD